MQLKQLKRELNQAKTSLANSNQWLVDLSRQVSTLIANNLANWTSDSRCQLRMTDQCPRFRALMNGESDPPVCTDCPLRRY
jgi:hypothetical protein